MAVTRIGNVNPSRLTGGNEPDGDDLCLDGAFVSDDVYVLTTVINERHSCCVRVRRATRIIPGVVRHGSGYDDDQGMSGMGVPASTSSRLPGVIQDVAI